MSEQRAVRIEKYPFIRAWGTYMGSYPYYIEGEKERAEKDNAPGTALFRRSDGSWALFEDLHPETKAILERILA